MVLNPDIAGGEIALLASIQTPDARLNADIHYLPSAVFNAFRYHKNFTPRSITRDHGTDSIHRAH